MGFINNTFTKLQTKAEENNTFVKLQTKAEETFDKVKVNTTKTTVVKKPTDSTTSTTTTTSWDKAVSNLNVIVTGVSMIDPDGVDIVFLGGKEGNPEWYRNVKDTKGLKALVTKEKPSGKCNLGATMEDVLTEAFNNKDIKKRPVSILVLTTGHKPDDASLLEKSLLDATKKIAKSGVKESPLSVTFIQIGGDEDQRRDGAYFKQLERKMAKEKFQIVDTMTDVEIKSTMKEINNKSTKISSSKTGLIAGGLAGAAISAGGMYAYNKHQEAKKTSSSKKNDFNGQFKCFYENEEITTLQVVDDQQGNLFIEGFHEEIMVFGKYSGFHEKVITKKESVNKKGQTSGEEDIDIEVDEKIHVHEVLKNSSGEEIDIDIDVKIDVKEKAKTTTKQKAQRLHVNGEVDVIESEVFIRFTNPSSGELIEGTYMEEERIIKWSDGSRWEAADYVSSEEQQVRVKNNTKLVAGAAVVGAIAAGTTGYMIDKKFFNKKVSKEDQCDYIIIVDRSAKMGRPHNNMCATTEEEINIEIHEEIHAHEDIMKKKEKKGRTSRKEDIDIDIEVDEKIHVYEDFNKKSSGGSKTKRTKEEIDIEIDVKIDVKEKVTATKQKTQIPAYLRK